MSSLGSAVSSSATTSAASNDVLLFPIHEGVADHQQQRSSSCPGIAMLPLQSFPPTSHSPCTPEKIIDDDEPPQGVRSTVERAYAHIIPASHSTAIIDSEEEREAFRRISAGGEFSLQSADSNASLRRPQRLRPSTVLHRPTSLRRVCSMLTAASSVFSPTLLADLSSPDEAPLQSLLVADELQTYSAFGESLDGDMRESHLAPSIASSTQKMVAATGERTNSKSTVHF